MLAHSLYDRLYNAYAWWLPPGFHIAQACCHRWAVSPHEARQPAIYFEDQVGQLSSFSYGQLAEKVNRLSNGLQRIGVQPGDRVALALQHGPEVLVSLLATLSVGAVAVPLGAQGNASDYDYYFSDCQPRLVLADKHSIAAVLYAIDHNPQLRATLKQIIGLRLEDERVIPWRTLLARQPTTFNCMPAQDGAAILCYTAVGAPANAITHTDLIGQLPGFVCTHHWFPQKDSIFYTDFDWSSPQGLLQGALPTLYFGRTLVGCPAGRTIPRLFTLLAHYPVRHALLSLPLWQRIQSEPQVWSDFSLDLRSLAIPAIDNYPELAQWVQAQFHLPLNSQGAPHSMATIVSDCPTVHPNKPGSLGCAVPGFELAVLDEKGQPVKPNTAGWLYVRQSHKHISNTPGLPVVQWHQGQYRPIERFHQQWCQTGWRVQQDAQGYFWPAH